MTSVKKLTAIAVTTVFFVACRKDIKGPDPVEEASAETTSAKVNEERGYSHSGYVYTLSNQSTDNKVMVYRRDSDGELSFIKSYSSGGNGTGSGLGSQGAVTLAGNDNILLAVNAGSNTISSFKVSHDELELISTVGSKGIKPISIAQYDKLVYVLNAGGNGNISGFRIAGDGQLIAIPNSTRPLSSNASDPAQISFVNEGTALVITEKGTNKIITYTVNHFGVPAAFHSLASANATPFGFAVGEQGKIYVSEAAGGAAGASSVSSYRVGYNGAISLTNGPVLAGQTAACWVVLTGNGKYVYATNTGSNSVSSFTANLPGNINTFHAVAANSGTTPIDAALSDQSKFLYVLNANGHSISVFRVSDNGELSNIQTVTGLPAGDIGLAAE
ncbi:MAG: beta-propeller fold lactonase family protein [Bacteroidota bacterium]|nr:beta-propeller fold lactonase family protein [Bacteroidota bacterium]